MCLLSVVSQPITPTGQTATSVSTISVSIALATNSASVPAATKARITNIGDSNVFVLLGDSSVVVDYSTGMPILPNSSVEVSIGVNTHLAAISDASFDGIYITTGF